MTNFDLKKFLVENKLTTNSKALNERAMSMADLDSMKIVTDEYLAEKEIQVKPSEDGSGQKVLDLLKPRLVSTIEADEDEAGADSYNVYDLGDGHLLVIDDYEGQFGIYRSKELKEYDMEKTGESIQYEFRTEEGSRVKIGADNLPGYINSLLDKAGNKGVTLTFISKIGLVPDYKITNRTDDMGRPMNQ